MAIVVVNEIEGGDLDLYEKVNEEVFEGGKLPDGCHVHIAGPVENGWRVITVWDSHDQFEDFRDETLIPAIRAAGADDHSAEKISTNPVHNLMTHPAFIEGQTGDMT